MHFNSVIEPAILEAVEGVQERHVKQTDHLPNSINREETNNHALNEKQCLKEEVEEHVCNDLTNTGKRLSFTTRHFKGQVSYILEPDGVDDLTEDKEGENPESTKDRCEEKLQPGPNTAMKGGVTNDFCRQSLQQWDENPIEEKQTEPEHSPIPGTTLKDSAGHFWFIVRFTLFTLCPSLCQRPTGPSPPLLFSFLLNAGIQFGDCANPQNGVLDPHRNIAEEGPDAVCHLGTNCRSINCTRKGD